MSLDLPGEFVSQEVFHSARRHLPPVVTAHDLAHTPLWSRPAATRPAASSRSRSRSRELRASRNELQSDQDRYARRRRWRPPTRRATEGRDVSTLPLRTHSASHRMAGSTPVPWMAIRLPSQPLSSACKRSAATGPATSSATRRCGRGTVRRARRTAERKDGSAGVGGAVGCQPTRRRPGPSSCRRPRESITSTSSVAGRSPARARRRVVFPADTGPVTTTLRRSRIHSMQAAKTAGGRI